MGTSLKSVGSRMMAMGSKWLEPTGVGTLFGIAMAVLGVVWYAAAIAVAGSSQAEISRAANATLTANLHELQSSMATGFQTIQTQIASLPVQGARLKAVEEGLKDQRQDNIGQSVDINRISQGLAVLVSTVDTIHDDVKALKDGINGRLPGARR